MSTSDNDSIKALSDLVADFVTCRDWDQFHTPKNLSQSIAIEAAEILEIFQWMTSEEANNAVKEPEINHHLGEELADVMIYCLSLASRTNIDLNEAIRAKVAKNEGRFPVDVVKGKFSRHKDGKWR